MSSLWDCKRLSFFFSSRRRHTRLTCDWSSDVCSSDLRARAGPTAARHFADWGADVIKVEMPKSAEDDPMGGARHGPDFFNLHRNKRSITLNLKQPEGVAILKKLATAA